MGFFLLHSIQIYEFRCCKVIKYPSYRKIKHSLFINIANRQAHFIQKRTAHINRKEPPFLLAGKINRIHTENMFLEIFYMRGSQENDNKFRRQPDCSS